MKRGSSMVRFDLNLVALLLGGAKGYYGGEKTGIDVVISHSTFLKFS